MIKSVLGLNFTTAGEAELTQTIVEIDVPSGEGPRVLATANLDHVVNLAVNDDLKRAYSRAWAITADGMPVYLYARLRGLMLPGRVTGSDLCWRILDRVSARKHRLFFVLSSEETANRIRAEMLRRGFPAQAIQFRVPPFGFETDDGYSRAMADSISQHGTTHLFFGVGSPKSEVWSDRFRLALGDCYVLNFGAGLDFFAGTRTRAPRMLRQTGLEWAWRLALEPKRLARRYLVNSWRFLWVVGVDMASRNT